MKPVLLFFSFFFLSALTHAACPYPECTVNVYAWSGEIPESVARQFEKETGVKVHLSTFENNEMLFTKLRSQKNAQYDIIMPSSYFIQRMKKYNLLEPLDLNKLPNRTHLSRIFQQPDYDPQGHFSVPFIFGLTGIFINTKHLHAPIHSWKNLWDASLKNQLLLLDDSREVFSMALLSMGYKADDTDPKHLKKAFLSLKNLMENVKVFSNEMAVSIMIDEDASIGMTWTGDFLKAFHENPSLQFIFPKEGYVMWIDNLAISKNAPHKDAAHAFINFLLRPDVAKIVAEKTRFPITNESARKLLPQNMQNDPIAYPDQTVLKKAHVQGDPKEHALMLMQKYWEELKISF